MADNEERIYQELEIRIVNNKFHKASFQALEGSDGKIESMNAILGVPSIRDVWAAWKENSLDDNREQLINNLIKDARKLRALTYMSLEGETLASFERIFPQSMDNSLFPGKEQLIEEAKQKNNNNHIFSEERIRTSQNELRLCYNLANALHSKNDKDIEELLKKSKRENLSQFSADLNRCQATFVDKDGKRISGSELKELALKPHTATKLDPASEGEIVINYIKEKYKIPDSHIDILIQSVNQKSQTTPLELYNMAHMTEERKLPDRVERDTTSAISSTNIYLNENGIQSISTQSNTFDILFDQDKRTKAGQTDKTINLNKAKDNDSIGKPYNGSGLATSTEVVSDIVVKHKVYNEEHIINSPPKYFEITIIKSPFKSPIREILNKMTAPFKQAYKALKNSKFSRILSSKNNKVMDSSANRYERPQNLQHSNKGNKQANDKTPLGEIVPSATPIDKGVPTTKKVGRG